MLKSALTKTLIWRNKVKKILSPMEKMDFPESEELPEGVREIEAEDTFGY